MGACGAKQNAKQLVVPNGHVNDAGNSNSAPAKDQSKENAIFGESVQSPGAQQPTSEKVEEELHAAPVLKGSGDAPAQLASIDALNVPGDEDAFATSVSSAHANEQPKKNTIFEEGTQSPAGSDAEKPPEGPMPPCETIGTTLAASEVAHAPRTLTASGDVPIDVFDAPVKKEAATGEPTIVDMTNKTEIPLEGAHVVDVPAELEEKSLPKEARSTEWHVTVSAEEEAGGDAQDQQCSCW